jgi:hypothetical protein
VKSCTALERAQRIQIPPPSERVDRRCQRAFIAGLQRHADLDHSLPRLYHENRDIGGPPPPLSGSIAQASNNAQADARETNSPTVVDARFTSPMMVEIFNFYTSEGTGDEKLNFPYVVQRLGYTKQQVRESIEYHLSGGYIYETIDGNHHKSIEGA